MKRILLAGATLLALATAQPTLAADAPVYKGPAPAAIALFNWSGFYVGGHLGGAWSNTAWTWELPTIVEALRVTNNVSGWIGGGHIGAQHQWGNLVAGIEASWSAAGLTSRITTPFVAGFDRHFDAKVNSIIIVAGRLGMAMDRSLIYAKAGYASAIVDLTTFRAFDDLLMTDSSRRDHGWMGGIGWEYALVNNIILGLEYNYISLRGGDRLNVNLPSTVTSHHRDVNTVIHTIWGRLSVKLGG